MLTITVRKNFCFDFNIFQCRVALYKINVFCDVAIANLCRKSRLASRSGETVFFTESNVSRHFSKNISCHFKSITDFCAVRKEVSVFGFCKPSLSSVECVIVKSHVVSVSLFDSVFFHHVHECFTNCVEVCDNSLTACDFFLILRNLISIVSRIH